MKQDIQLTVSVPDDRYKLYPNKIYKTGDSLVALFELSCGRVTSTEPTTVSSKTITVDLPDATEPLPVKYYVQALDDGDSPAPWMIQDNVTFISSVSKPTSAVCLYDADAGPNPDAPGVWPAEPDDKVYYVGPDRRPVTVKEMRDRFFVPEGGDDASEGAAAPVRAPKV